MISKILFLFMIYSMLGWLWETPYVSLKEKKYINRGFLRGPYIPIYGYAVLTIIFSMNIFSNMDQNNIFIIVIEIVFMSLVSVFWEFFTSLGLEIVFKTRWWDYSNRKFNIKGRVALDYTILFGVGGFVLWRYVNPIIEGFYNGISSELGLVIIVVFYLIYAIDNIYTFKDLFKLRDIIIKLEDLRYGLSTRYDHLFEQAYKSIQVRREDFKTTFGGYKNTIVKELSNIKSNGEGKLIKSFENKIKQLNNIIESSQNISRFFNKFPKAPSRSFEYLKSLIHRTKK